MKRDMTPEEKEKYQSTVLMIGLPIVCLLGLLSLVLGVILLIPVAMAYFMPPKV